MKNLIAALLCVVSFAAQADVRVLAYHRITAAHPAGDTVIAPADFEKHLASIQRLGYRTVTIAEVTAYMKGTLELPAKSVAITFDDGWKDQLVAADMLRQKKMTGTFFVTSGHFGEVEYMSEDDVVGVAANFEIGAHSHSHFPTFLKDGKMPLSEMVGELAMSKLLLERVLAKPVTSYAWPYGHATTSSVQFAERLGFTSSSMINATSQNKIGDRPMEIARINISGRCSSAQLEKILESGILQECK